MDWYPGKPDFSGYSSDWHFSIYALLWVALIFLALFVLGFYAWHAIEWLRNRWQFDGVAVEGGHSRDPDEPWELSDDAISSPLADDYHGEVHSAGAENTFLRAVNSTGGAVAMKAIKMKVITRPDPNGTTCSTCGSDIEQVGHFMTGWDGSEEMTQVSQWQSRCSNPECEDRR
jgi:hypothetical protein